MVVVGLYLKDLNNNKTIENSIILLVIVEILKITLLSITPELKCNTIMKIRIDRIQA